MAVVSGEEAVAVVKDADSGRWAEMIPEILGKIFVRISIPVDEMLRIMPLVCKGWMKAMVGPLCWGEIDIYEWSLCHITAPYAVDLAVIKLVNRGDRILQRLSAYRLRNPSFVYIANRGSCLTVLEIPMSILTEHVVMDHIKLLPNLKELDISACTQLTTKCLEAFGNQCKSLVCLKRNMIPEILTHSGELYISDTLDDSEAKTIANTMPNLQHLELCYVPFSVVGLSAILTKCTSLSRLDLTGTSYNWIYNLNHGLKKTLHKIKYSGLWKPFLRNRYFKDIFRTNNWSFRYELEVKRYLRTINVTGVRQL